MRENYLKQVAFLLDILPVLNEYEVFALKGGTAINFFYQNAPRLSVDIDLSYLPVEPREQFLLNLTQALENLVYAIQKVDKNINIKRHYTNKDKQLSKLRIFKEDVEVKIEPNLVLRGYVFEPATQRLCKQLQDQFLQSFKINTMSKADVYGGKICAALDRQHPRDLFDVKLLLDHEKISDDIRKAFIVYLASSPRPMSELLNPNLINISDIFFKEFAGMTNISVTLEELLETREKLLGIIQKELTEKERLFLCSIKQGEPDWSLIDLPHIQQLPAIQWKLANIRKMETKKRSISLESLKNILEL
ncbi:MAG: nucleotidyl transferase AbiEii/AbiGii toxin family protein [Gammaproteobacteria bacterium]|jgi:predicted nucleotidyltransferase component of viral defense system